MCKRLVCLSAALFVFACSALCVFASGADVKDVLEHNEPVETEQPVEANPQITSHDSEILIVYPDELTEKEKDTLAVVVETMTFLGHTADYYTESESAAKLGEYEQAVCCLLDYTPAFEQSLARYEGRVLFLGGISSRVPNASEFPRYTPNKGQTGAVARYTFSGMNTFESVAALDTPVFVGNASYTAGTLSVGEYELPLVCGWDGGKRYIPLTDYTSRFARAVLMQEVELWLWPYSDAPHSYAQFIVIDSVYPFTDPQKLNALVQELSAQKVNYVISVMPIYDNADFPAMKQLCEILRFAQANGGAVILRAPIIQGTLDFEELAQKLTDATQSYFDNEVYPLALEIPRSWMYNDDVRSTLGRYRTLFVYDDGTAGECLDLDKATNDFVRLGAQLVAPAITMDATGAGYLDCCASAVYIDSASDVESALVTLQAARDSTVPLKSLWNMEHIVYLNEFKSLFWDGTALKVNDERVSTEYEPREYEEDYDYKRTLFYRATADLESQNEVLIIFVSIALPVFVLSIVLARRQMKKRFLVNDKRDGPPDIPGVTDTKE